MRKWKKPIDLVIQWVTGANWYPTATIQPTDRANTHFWIGREFIHQHLQAKSKGGILKAHILIVLKKPQGLALINVYFMRLACWHYQQSCLDQKAMSAKAGIQRQCRGFGNSGLEKRDWQLGTLRVNPVAGMGVEKVHHRSMESDDTKTQWTTGYAKKNWL